MKSIRSMQASKLLLMALITAVVPLVLSVIFQFGTNPIAAQESKSDLQQLIEKLNSDYILKGDQVTFRFAAPLDDGGLSELTIPGSQREGTVDFFVLTEIGTDHVCISQNFGGLDSVNCIPYSNIADITYSYPPSSGS